MLQNVGSVDRDIRVVAGLGLIGASLFGFIGLIGLWGWIGVVALVTGLFRFCPVYLPFGPSTCAARADNSSRWTNRGR
ncbi:hypothetical protein BH11PSE10_BH11PSE10_10240 [soil metagenome]